ncbi:hypothetical protein [Phenylobacterium deserti]|uniref:DUF2214 domain-containing protein n=1 Tax=Phenylobacterium deserti TaxID=1914756 RepID=A0A328AQC8_9CAUL|nr:hypothetical protein [Phenylobacterium deserti]RAK56521.1 hypothetical protein DJ018_00620 [Phenylobacterium deserti]
MEALSALAAGLEASPLGAWVRGSAIGYPLANLLHLLGLILLLGGIGLMDLRLAGLFRRLPVAALSQVLIPAAMLGLALLVASGTMMFAADAQPLLRSTVFRWKLLAIGLALLNVAAFHALWGRRFEDWDRRAGILARFMAAGSLLLWLSAATLGCLIAYA